MTTPQLTADHYRDAIAICRATLARDHDGLEAIFQSCHPAMTVQAIVMLHLNVLLGLGGSEEIVDQFLADYLAQIAAVEDN